MGKHNYITPDTTIYALDRIGDSLLSFAGKTAYAHWRNLCLGDRLPHRYRFLETTLGGFDELFAICTGGEGTPRIQYWGRYLEEWLGPRQIGEPLLGGYADTYLTDRLSLINQAISKSSVGRIMASSPDVNS